VHAKPRRRSRCTIKSQCFESSAFAPSWTRWLGATHLATTESGQSWACAHTSLPRSKNDLKPSEFCFRSIDRNL